MRAPCCPLTSVAEAAFYATQAAQLERRDGGSAFDAFTAYALAAECHALGHRYVEVERTLELMHATATSAVKADSSWSGFIYKACT